MARILIIDDDAVIRKIIAAVLTRLGYAVTEASDGLEGLKAVQFEIPDLVVTDVMIPRIDGYEVPRRLWRDPALAPIPVLVLTGQSELEEKLHAFEAGADDHMGKPFEPAELAARVSKLLRWSEVLREAQAQDHESAEGASLVAVHSLRGGIGCSNLAVNLALALDGLWESLTLLLDLAKMAGPVALMLDVPLKRTWADPSRCEWQELDRDLVQTVIDKHDSGLDFIAGPTFPEEAEELTAELLKASLDILFPRYDYSVADVAHDFGDLSIAVLDKADFVLVILAPEMASVRAAAAALDTYRKLGYDGDKVKLVLNRTFQHHGLARRAIEAVLRVPISLTILFAPDRFVPAVNLGSPFVASQPEDPVSMLVQDLAFRLSKERHRTIPPACLPLPGVGSMNGWPASRSPSSNGSKRVDNHDLAVRSPV